MINTGIWVIIAYLMGSVSSAIILCKLLNLPDPRAQGSGNPGATNVARIAGKKIAALVLVLDALKGFIPVVLVHYVLQQPFLTSLTALAAFLGHVYPVFFKFQGGKGVATSLGALLGISWLLGGLFAAVWLIIAFTTRLSSFAALLAMAATTLAMILWMGWIISLPVVVMLIILYWRHRANIARLWAGTEAKI